MSLTYNIKAVYYNGKKTTICGKHISKGIEHIKVINSINYYSDIDHHSIRDKRIKYYETNLNISSCHSGEGISYTHKHDNLNGARLSLNNSFNLLYRLTS